MAALMDGIMDGINGWWNSYIDILRAYAIWRIFINMDAINGWTSLMDGINLEEPISSGYPAHMGLYLEEPGQGGQPT